MIFLTYNDSYSGIYKSQVMDVCTFFEKEMGVKTKLLALVSLRNFSEQKQLIKSAYCNSIVLPMFPKVRFWKVNTLWLFLVCLVCREKKVWTRGAFACNMALSLKKQGFIQKVIFDARGAYQAELNEYDVVKDERIKKNISAMEQRCLEKSDAQLAVSGKLVEWWEKEYSFEPKKYSVIPCTLSEDFLTTFPSEKELSEGRKQLGFSEEDLVLAYAGSAAGWQSFELVDEFLYAALEKNKNAKLLFLSKEIPHNSKIFKQFADRIVTKWVKPADVKKLLQAADYGLLVREKSVTNKVSSPVKFAEYLACGLEVIISEEIGDFSDFVKQNNCGVIYSKEINLSKVPYSKKGTNHQLALANFSKSSPVNKKGYSQLLQA